MPKTAITTDLVLAEIGAGRVRRVNYTYRLNHGTGQDVDSEVYALHYSVPSLVALDRDGGISVTGHGEDRLKKTRQTSRAPLAAPFQAA